ncbi:hypothetical protein [Deinococcus gobiensis]|uniref:Uncharacterized protein n=1 Tax=Deinococcus gobiensis (strain DSM 21396 / JCM 16679 / CGMCC 1.7299 / I-0) TaxID=745776 RepID=H8H1N7_DEIGI|nr:hypothetical protein [Deinococcus gobiensis]AFD27434.1 hypothetical protein DGo_PB0165 [Deinococcus gobiensis I-0]
MSEKTLQEIGENLLRIIEEHEALVVELRRHPSRDDHLQTVFIQQLVLSGDDAVRQAVETSIRTLVVQRDLMERLLYALGPVPPCIRPLLN